MTDDPLLAGLRQAVEASPDNVVLRAHLAQLLANAGHVDEAVVQAAAALGRDPGCVAALAVVASASALRQPPQAEATAPVNDADVLGRLDAQLADVAPPMFTASAAVEVDAQERGLGEVQDAGLRLADVGGLGPVKARLEAAFLGPLRNPQLRSLYRTSLRGGLLLYGPPGCGKTMMARALAGELGARLLAVSLAEILDMYLGQSERNMHDVFARARAHAPCVLFLDEVDALGQKRSQLHGAGRGTVTQLLTEMDGIAGGDDAVYVLAATNHPWDVDVALRRPGRFDRMMFVPPPDQPAREAILRGALRDRPIANINLGTLAKATAGYSGADLTHLCQTAAERALQESVKTGTVRLIEMVDFQAALGEVRASIGPWLQIASNVAEFANDDGGYNDLLAYLRQRPRP